MIDASLYLFYVDPLLDWNPKSCGDDGSALNLDDFFYFFGECLKKNQNASRPPEHAPVRECQNKRLGGTIGYYYDKGVYNMSVRVRVMLDPNLVRTCLI